MLSTKGLNTTQVDTVKRLFIDLKDAIDSAKNSTGGLNESTLNYIESLSDATRSKLLHSEMKTTEIRL